AWDRLSGGMIKNLSPGKEKRRSSHPNTAKILTLLWDESTNGNPTRHARSHDHLPDVDSDAGGAGVCDVQVAAQRRLSDGAIRWPEMETGRGLRGVLFDRPHFHEFRLRLENRG